MLYYMKCGAECSDHIYIYMIGVSSEHCQFISSDDSGSHFVFTCVNSPHIYAMHMWL